MIRFRSSADSRVAQQIWWSYNIPQKAELSLWRPLAPPGYYPVGDCASHGFKPPQRCLVVRDDGDGALAAPTSFVQVFRDTGSRARKPEHKEGTLALWRPVPPPGRLRPGAHHHPAAGPLHRPGGRAPDPMLAPGAGRAGRGRRRTRHARLLPPPRRF